ncbi:hypothetical protein Pmani_027699 [Petrolisthes manimaculis]|uniref:Uncharacterized protein n=1 Tax=Petrolisthes manimaculis TaxID=1843537 RepID=A0AAE1P3M5_9EUCA|nr:hypothetical protein Pmani_027699 [Petrolisthes manimaculis]
MTRVRTGREILQGRALMDAPQGTQGRKGQGAGSLPYPACLTLPVSVYLSPPACLLLPVSVYLSWYLSQHD